MKPLNTTLLKHHQIEELQAEKEGLQEAVSPSNPYKKNIAQPKLMHSRLKQIETTLEKYAPEELPGHEKDVLAKRELELREKWTQGMPTEEEMRKNPAGMVDRHRKWEKVNKSAILEWKNVRRQLEAGSDDPDLSNIERYRPTGHMDRMRTDAQIPGMMTYHKIPEEVWDMAFEGKKPENTALAQVERVHEEKRGRREWTEEQKADARNRLAAARAKKAQLRQAEQSATV
jgi:hypothetical protein